MKKKIVGILVMTLLITTVIPVTVPGSILSDRQSSLIAFNSTVLSDYIIKSFENYVHTCFRMRSNISQSIG